jgi:hypothetical protein
VDLLKKNIDGLLIKRVIMIKKRWGAACRNPET